MSLLSLIIVTGDTKHVLTGSADNSCRLWDCETGKFEHWPSVDNLRCPLVSYHNDRVLLTDTGQADLGPVLDLKETLMKCPLEVVGVRPGPCMGICLVMSSCPMLIIDNIAL